MVIFHSYVSLPEGNHDIIIISHYMGYITTIPPAITIHSGTNLTTVVISH